MRRMSPYIIRTRVLIRKDDDIIVPESELEKVRLMLCAREPIELNVTMKDLDQKRKKQCEDRKKKQVRSKGRKR